MKNYLILLLLVILSSCLTPAERIMRKDEKAPKMVKKVEGTSEVIPEITGNPIAAYKPLISFNGDTTQYVLQSIIDRKEAYIQKELAVLLNDFEIPVKFYSPHSGPNNLEAYTHLYLKVFNPIDEKRREMKNENPLILLVTFKIPVVDNRILPLFVKTQGQWTNEAKGFFSTQVISNIQLVEYNLK
jgi:hypothetical protein